MVEWHFLSDAVTSSSINYAMRHDLTSTDR